jgi:hypothetical protein
MKFRRSLFWDVNPQTIDEKKHARYIIERILDFGTGKEIHWLFQKYSRSEINNILKLKRSTILPKSRALWELILK